MREILFRGKRMDNGVWVEGIPQKANNKILMFNKCYSLAVIPETVVQYSGVTDDSDEEIKIFENDILEVQHQGKVIKCKVEFEGGAFVLISNEFADGYIALFEICEFDRDSCWVDGKVIGNIHDNPELLDRKEI